MTIYLLSFLFGVINVVMQQVGNVLSFLVGIRTLESCGTREWLVFSWHL